MIFCKKEKIFAKIDKFFFLMQLQIRPAISTQSVRFCYKINKILKLPGACTIKLFKVSTRLEPS